MKLRTASGSAIRDMWLEASKHNQALLTFEDLDPGDKFILYPEPNRRLSYRGPFLFVKMKNDGNDPHFPISCGEHFALSLVHGDKHFFAKENIVIKIIDRPISA